MMRHSKLEMTGRYTRPRAVDLDAAAAMLPSLKPEGDKPESLAMTGTDSGPVTTPQNALTVKVDGCNPNTHQGVVAISGRYVNPLVEGSSPSPVTTDRTRQETPRADIPKGLGQGDIRSRVRQYAAVNAPIRPLTATENAARLLPTDPGLATVIDAWDQLPGLLRDGIVAMVKSASKGGGR